MDTLLFEGWARYRWCLPAQRSNLCEHKQYLWLIFDSNRPLATHGTETRPVISHSRNAPDASMAVFTTRLFVKCVKIYP